jgi:hypothetical protein
LHVKFAILAKTFVAIFSLQVMTTVEVSPQFNGAFTKVHYSPECAVCHCPIAHTQALKGLSKFSTACSVQSMTRVMGGRSGRVCFPFSKLARPQIDQLIRFRSSSDNSHDQPCAQCQAAIPERYLQTVLTETGSKAVSATMTGLMSSGLEAAHNANECSSLNDVGRQSNSGMVNMSQNKWSFLNANP